MEAQIATEGRGTGFDVPEQGLHLRAAGRDVDDRTVRRGVLDTSMGPVMVEEVQGRLVTVEAVHTAVVEESAAGAEKIVPVHEQFVELVREGERYVGTIATQAGPAQIAR